VTPPQERNYDQNRGGGAAASMGSPSGVGSAALATVGRAEASGGNQIVDTQNIFSLRGGRLPYRVVAVRKVISRRGRGRPSGGSGGN